MAKFKVKLKITGFELEIEGSQDQTSAIGKDIGNQISSFLQPAVNIIEHDSLNEASIDLPKLPPENSLTHKKGKRRKNSSNHVPDPSADYIINFRHDAERFGYPKQEWKTAVKAMWLIHVLNNTNLGEQFSARALVSTFNKHFKQAGTVTTSNTTRDLGYAKTKDSPAQVGEDSNKSPSEWYLTTEGKKKAQQLVTEIINVSEQV